MNNEQLQRRLLSEPRLTFAKAMEISRTFETTTEDARTLQRDASGAEALAVNVLSNPADTAVRQTANYMANQPCFDVGEPTHQLNAGLSKRCAINVTRRAT